MDGTIYDLYNSVDNWLQKIENEENGLFTDGKPMMKLENFYKLCSELLSYGVEFGVITWLPMGASPEFCELCKQEKLKWIDNYIPFVKEIHITEYGFPKEKCITKRATNIFLIDDNSEVCKEFEYNSKQRKSINLTDDFQVNDALEMLLEFVKENR